MSRGTRIVPHSESELANLARGTKMQDERFWEKVATLDELMFMEVDAQHIPERAGWGTKKNMGRALRRKNLLELWERYRDYAARSER